MDPRTACVLAGAVGIAVACGDPAPASSADDLTADASATADAARTADAAACDRAVPDPASWITGSTAILDFDPFYILTATDPGDVDREITARLVPPYSPFVAQPPAWDGTASPPAPIPLCDPADVTPAECSIAVELRILGRQYQATSGTMKLERLEPLQPPVGTPLDAWRYVLTDAVFTSEDGSECLTAVELALEDQ